MIRKGTGDRILPGVASRFSSYTRGDAYRELTNAFSRNEKEGNSRDDTRSPLHGRVVTFRSRVRRGGRRRRRPVVADVFHSLSLSLSLSHGSLLTWSRWSAKKKAREGGKNSHAGPSLTRGAPRNMRARKREERQRSREREREREDCQGTPC